jgi:hypothetical protein
MNWWIFLLLPNSILGKRWNSVLWILTNACSIFLILVLRDADYWNNMAILRREKLSILSIKAQQCIFCIKMQCISISGIKLISWNELMNFSPIAELNFRQKVKFSFMNTDKCMLNFSNYSSEQNSNLDVSSWNQPSHWSVYFILGKYLEIIL